MKKIISLMLVASLCFGTGVYSATPVKNTISVLFGNQNILINDKTKILKNSNGAVVKPIVYNNLTYLPVTSDLKNLSGVGIEVASGQVKITSPYTISDAKVTLNENPIVLTDKDNNSVMPILYKGSFYLPLDLVSKAVEKSVLYDRKSNTINIGQTTGLYSPDKKFFETPLLKTEPIYYYYPGISNEPGPNPSSCVFRTQKKDLRFNDDTKAKDPHSVELAITSIFYLSRTASLSEVHLTQSKYSTFKGKVGFAAGMNEDRGPVTFEVFDYDTGELLYSKDIKITDTPVEFNVNIKNINKIKTTISGCRYEVILDQFGLYQ